MRFELVDRIVELSRGQRIVVVKAVSLSEEYLADHFPSFPVLPGVLMLQVLTEAAAWIVRDAYDFSVGAILPREAKNVVFKSFVKPGNLLRVEVNCRRLARSDSDFEGCGYCNDEEVLKARIGLVHLGLDDDGNMTAPVRALINEEAKSRFSRLWARSES